MKTISRYIMTLALLLTAVTGAWAQSTFGVKEITADMLPASWSTDESAVTADDLAKLGFMEVTKDDANTWTGAPQQGTVRLIYTLCESVNWVNGEGGYESSYKSRKIFYSCLDGQKIFITTEPGIDVTPGTTPNTWTFTQPGSDVVLTPQYAPTAAWATTGSGSGVKTLLPEAAEGVIAGTTAPLIAEGTGIVAFAGTTENPQGLVMYYAAKGTADAAPTAPTLESLWSADVPTAEAYINDEDGATVYVWYYIAGANTPDGETPTADNTFNDSEICAKPLKVTLLSNKFDLTLKAANANTIEAGKATVTVGGTAATVTEGKLQGVKMGSEVKMTAKQGYKFRKVEVKKGAKAPTTAQLNVPTGWNGVNTNVTANDLPGFVALTDEEAANIPCPDAEGYVYVIHNFVGDGYIRIIAFNNGERQGQQSYTLARYHDEIYYDVNNNQIKYYYTTGK